MELIVHIVLGLAIVGLIYEYVKLIQGYAKLADAYEQLELEAFSVTEQVLMTYTSATSSKSLFT